MGQVNAGNCWLMRRLGESYELPRPWAVPAQATAEQAVAARAPAAAPVASQAVRTPAEAISGTPPADPAAAFVQGRLMLNAGKRREAVAHFLAAFRHGSADLRGRAVAELERLGEVELF